MSTLDKKKSNNNHKNINEHSKNEKNENDDVQMMQCTFICVKCSIYSNTFVNYNCVPLICITVYTNRE